MCTRLILILDRPDILRLPIIAIIASTFVEDIIRCKEAGMNAHVAKPIDAKNVIQLICGMLK